MDAFINYWRWPVRYVMVDSLASLSWLMFIFCELQFRRLSAGADKCCTILPLVSKVCTVVQKDRQLAHATQTRRTWPLFISTFFSSNIIQFLLDMIVCKKYKLFTCAPDIKLIGWKLTLTAVMMQPTIFPKYAFTLCWDKKLWNDIWSLVSFQFKENIHNV